MRALPTAVVGGFLSILMTASTFALRASPLYWLGC